MLACLCRSAGLLGSVGLGFLVSTKYLLPFTAAFLVLTLAALIFRAKNRHGYGPFVLGVLSAVGILLGKFRWESNPALYGAVGLLIPASLWNGWPRRVTTAACCAENSIN